MDNKRQFLLGVFFIVALSILGFYTLFLTDVRLFSKPILETVYFADGYGLKKGDQVRAAGARIGRVKDLSVQMSAEPRRRIRVVLSLDQELELLQGARVAIQESTLLGGRHVNIDPGLFGGPPLERDRDRALYGVVRKNPIQSLGEIGNLFVDNRDAIARIVANLDQLTTGLDEGRGTLGLLLKDEEVAADLAASITSLRATTAKIDSGEGLLGALINDAEMAESVRSTFTSLRTIADDVRGGQGVIGRLIYDDALADEVQRAFDAFDSFASIGERIDRGEGVMGRLVTDEELAQNVEDIITSFQEVSGDLEAIAARVRSGEGSLGKLLMDEELYDEALATVQLLTRSLEDYREAAPITAFTSVLFSAF